jgi:hypothetical protein
VTVPTKVRDRSPAESIFGLAVGRVPLPFLTIRIVFFSDMSDRYVELLTRCRYRHLAGEGVTI